MPNEIERIEAWLKETTEPYVDWSWDGLELKVFNKKEVETYSREMLEDLNVLERRFGDERKTEINAE